MQNGDFVWYELLTKDPKAAVPFYTDVVGWTTEAFQGGPMEYTMWVASQGTLGGTMPLPEQAAKMGAPPHWQANVSVTDVDAAVVKVKSLGGQVYSGPHDIPNVGRFAVIADPQGGVLSLFQPAGEMKPHDSSKPGEFSWNELATTDAEAALKFYGELFGWTVLERMDMGPMGTYYIYGKDSNQLGGIMNKPKEMPVVAWIHYILVADLDAAVAKAKARGANVVNGPMDVPGGRVAQLVDPQGAFFALHETHARA